MTHLDFVVWMLGFPIAWEIAEWIRLKRSEPIEPISDGAKGFAAVIVISLWWGIGAALW